MSAGETSPYPSITQKSTMPRVPGARYALSATAIYYSKAEA
jgi:hypothetical protein